MSYVRGRLAPKRIDKEEPIGDLIWFSFSDIENLEETISPANFAEHLPPFLAGSIPNAPFYIERKTLSAKLIKLVSIKFFIS